MLTLPRRNLLYLQLVLQMQKQLSENDTSNVLKKPEHILTFIKHALENPRQAGQPTSSRKPSTDTSLRMEDLRIVQDEEEPEEFEEGDSDDEDEEGDQEHGPDDMTSTAVKLLLAVLEGMPSEPFHTEDVLLTDPQQTPTCPRGLPPC